MTMRQEIDDLKVEAGQLRAHLKRVTAALKNRKEPAKLPCRICDEDEPRITSFRCPACKYPVCEEHRTSQHCGDCYP